MVSYDVHGSSYGLASGWLAACLQLMMPPAEGFGDSWAEHAKQACEAFEEHHGGGKNSKPYEIVDIQKEKLYGIYRKRAGIL